MRQILTTRRYLKDIKRLQRRKVDIAPLNAIVLALANDEPLPPAARPHKLGGQAEEVWDLHVAPDWILLYGISDTQLLLHRTGSHADLF